MLAPVKSTSRFFKRVYRHLTRSQARAGWVLAIVSAVIYGLYPESWLASDTLKQFFLVVASVATGAVFLPELSSNLWSIDPGDVRGLIPDTKIKALEDSIVRAQVSDPSWADAILHSALRPLLGAEATPHFVLDSLSYSANVHLSRTFLDDEGTMRAHLAETVLRARRVLPPPNHDDLYWVSIARTPEALAGEYAEEACLLREIVELDPSWPDDEWRQRIEQLSSARILVNGKTTEARTRPDPDLQTGLAVTQGLVRWYFHASDLPVEPLTERTNISLALDFPMRIDYFSVNLTSYYTTGPSNITLRIYDAPADFRLNHQPFLGRALGHGQLDVDYKIKQELCHQVTVTTSDLSLLWPGSGLVAWWDTPYRLSDSGASAILAAEALKGDG
jgi:hypothetical protein